jgi:hypothetical protein
MVEKLLQLCYPGIIQSFQKLMFVMLLHTGQAEKLAWPRWEANFSACPVWMHTQSNTTNIIFTWARNTNTHKIIFQKLLGPSVH